MAQKLTAIYEAITKEEGGLILQMRLAMKTGVLSQKAGELPDSPENVKMFTDAYKDLTGKICPIT